MYTIKEEAQLKEYYTEQNLSVEQIAQMLGKPSKSVIAKLSLMKVYNKIERVSKVTGAAPKTKKEFVRDICEILEIDSLLGLDKAPKQTLIKLKDSLA